MKAECSVNPHTGNKNEEERASKEGDVHICTTII